MFDANLGYSIVKKSLTIFLHGDFEIKDVAQNRIPTTVSIPETIDHIHDLILANQWILAK